MRLAALLATCLIAISGCDVVQDDHDPALYQNWRLEYIERGDVRLTPSGPEAYTVVFFEDGRYSALIDCNTETGEYAVGRRSRLRFGSGIMTYVECGEESLAEDFNEARSGTLVYELQDGRLTLRREDAPDQALVFGPVPVLL